MCTCIDPNSCFTKFWIRVVSQMRSCTHQICLNGDQAVAMKPCSAPAVASIHGGTWDSTTAAPCFVRACTTAARPTSVGPRISSSLRRRRACYLLRGCVQGTCRSAWECRTGLATQPAAAEEAAREERAHDAPSPSRLAAAAWSCCRAQACIRSPCAMSLKWLARTRPYPRQPDGPPLASSAFGAHSQSRGAVTRCASENSMSSCACITVSNPLRTQESTACQRHTVG